MHAEVVIIGAGAAGLAAACALPEAGCRVVVLEARNRLGGRILTRRAVGVDASVELGAEFIHGRARATLSRLARAGLPALDAARSHCIYEGAAFTAAEDRSAALQRAMQESDALEQRDMAFSDYLDTLALDDDTRASARRLVEGYDAADATRASARSIVEEWAGDAAADAPTFRPAAGYGALMEAMARESMARGAEFRLESVASQVTWRAAGATVSGTRHGAAFTLEARRVVVTLPLGVLQASAGSGAIRFSPALTAKRAALDGLASGPASKVVLEFREPWWETIDGGTDLAFLHARDARHPTWWTPLPLRAPLLTAWAAGPRTSTLREPVRQALEDLRTMFGRRVDDAFVAAYAHDWQADPFARGAYSYVKVGGGDARRQLAATIDDVLFFAGEATDTAGEAGTVAGALQSGERAAQAILNR